MQYSNYDVRLIIIQESLKKIKEIEILESPISGRVYRFDNLYNDPYLLIFIREALYSSREMIDMLISRIRRETNNKTAKDFTKFIVPLANGDYNQYLQLSPTLQKISDPKILRGLIQVREIRNKLKYKLNDLSITRDTTNRYQMQTSIEIPSYSKKIKNFEKIFNIKDYETLDITQAVKISLIMNIENYLNDLLSVFSSLK